MNAVIGIGMILLFAGFVCAVDKKYREKVKKLFK